MSEQVNLNATNREVDGKSSSRQLRRSGSVPAVIYGGEKDPIRISILEKDIAKAAEIPGFATQILNINISGEEQNVIVKEIQRHITSTASLFILINSIFGVAGQLTKDIVFNEFLNYWPLFISVLIGGQIGSFLNIKFLTNKILALMTSFLVIFVAIRMGFRLIA